jgi:transcriptional regulator with XRE-family HTH domain
MTPFGAHLRTLRAARGMSLKQLAAALEVSSAYVSALEHGRRGVPSVVLVHQVSDAMSLSWEEADELERLARLSHPRVVVNTAGLSPERTALANRLARTIRTLPPETVSALLAVLDGVRERAPKDGVGRDQPDGEAPRNS